MSRAYRGVFPKKFWVYSVDDLMRLFSVTANTVSNWVCDGLTPSDGHMPYVFQGAEVQRFHKARKARNANTLRAGEFSCRKCKSFVFPDISSITDNFPINGNHMYAAECPFCFARLWKISNQADRDIVEDCRNPNTTRDCLHEEDRPVPGGIWISEGSTTAALHTKNDRIIYEWLTFAGQYEVKTIDRHLATIRYFEQVLAGKPFSKLTREDVAKVRNDLKRRSNTEVLDSFSSSSIRHIISHLSAFFAWLSNRVGFKSLPQDLSGYLKLPQAVLASAAPVKQKDYPTIEEAELLLRDMPSRSLVDQRARAIFAIAFLGALRADTVISLRIKHVDISLRRIVQASGPVRAKAGKSMVIGWFPIPRCFGAAVTEWIHALKGLGFTDDDALFPSSDWLKHRPVAPTVNRRAVPVMSTIHAVTEAFAIACRDNAIKYTPHSAKHSIGALRDELALTQIQRKALSENMGHENEQITERHYGKLTDVRRFEVLEQIGENVRGESLKFSNEEKIAFFDGMYEMIRNR